jgi:hypothetical protein
MSRWFRFYDDAVNDPKLLRLSDPMFRAWVTLLCLASKHDGVLPETADIALMLRMKATKVAEWLAVLTAGGLFDNNNGIFIPHNWNARQYKSDVSTERVKRFRKQERNVSETVSETPPDTEQRQITETDSETEKKDIPLRGDDWPEDFGDLFWKAYPRKTEKLSAMKRLSNVRKLGIVTFTDLMAGVSRYAAAVSHNDPQFTKHPTTWLNAGCWADEIQPGGSNGARNFDQKRGSSSASFFAGVAGLAADLAGNGQPSRDEPEEIPVGRFNIEH